MTSPASPSLVVALWSPHAGTLPPDDVRAALAPVAPALAALLPDGDSPVAALGKAVHVAAGLASRDTEWTLYARRGGGSRWVRASAERERGAVRIEGADGVEVSPSGALTVDAGVPAPEADAIRAAYRAARGGIDAPTLGRHVSAWVVGTLRAVRASGAGGAWLLDAAHAPILRAVRDALAPLGATLAVHAIADPGDLAAYAPTVGRTLTDEIDKVIREADETLSDARAAAQGTGRVQDRSGRSTLAALDEVAQRASLWRTRLALSLGDVDARLAALRAAVDDAYTAALDAQRQRSDDARAALGGAPRPRPRPRKAKAKAKAKATAPATATEDAPVEDAPATATEDAPVEAAPAPATATEDAPVEAAPATATATEDAPVEAAPAPATEDAPVVEAAPAPAVDLPPSVIDDETAARRRAARRALLG